MRANQGSEALADAYGRNLGTKYGAEDAPAIVTRSLHSTEIAVTDRRIIFKRGLIRRHTVEMNMQKVESVDVDQTLMGRLFNYGNVTVRGTGSTFETLRMIDSPLKLRSTVTAG